MEGRTNGLYRDRGSDPISSGSGVLNTSVVDPKVFRKIDLGPSKCIALNYVVFPYRVAAFTRGGDCFNGFIFRA